MKESIPILAIVAIMVMLRLSIPVEDISFMEYHKNFILTMKHGDRGRLFNSPGPNSTLMENFNYIKNLPYKSDFELYGVMEYYASAKEFFEFKAGDCEDKAIAFASAAYYLGEPYNRENYVKVVFGSIEASSIQAAPLSSFMESDVFGHAWVEIGDKNITVYDPTLGIVASKKEYYSKYACKNILNLNINIRFFWFSMNSSGFY
ncbi:hypothetical protein DRO97_06260 [Archaeoglobales archaeon]|nr:MAG: hypothetical protein DRO97_06260 [Archaeoglobales archaeon]